MSAKPNLGIPVQILTILTNQDFNEAKTPEDVCLDGSVTQRFCLAILQKMTSKEEAVSVLLYRQKFVPWLLTLLEKAMKKQGKGVQTPQIHVFCLDFASALLANLFHSNQVLDLLERDRTALQSILTRLLDMLKEAALPTSVLVHALICLSYLSKERFSQAMEECEFVDRMS